MNQERTPFKNGMSVNFKNKITENSSFDAMVQHYTKIPGRICLCNILKKIDPCKLFLVTGLFIFLFIFSGCAQTRYLDKPTPPGSVPPVAYGNVVPVSSTTGSSAVDAYRQSHGEQLIVTEMDETHPGEEELAQYRKHALDIQNRFASLYVGKKKPRIALFINRSLSDRVNEWASNSRFIARGDGSISLADTSGTGVTSGLMGGTLVSGQTSKMDLSLDNGHIILKSQSKKNLGGERLKIRESILWQIENGFIQSFLRAKAKIVDRNTILRLIALEYDTNSLEDLPEKNIEMKALKKYADIYVELLVNSSGSAGYMFKAVAKELSTGRILAMANFTDQFAITSAPRQEIVTSGQGFHIVEKQSVTTFGFEELGVSLSVNLMDSFNTLWE